MGLLNMICARKLRCRRVGQDSECLECATEFMNEYKEEFQKCTKCMEFYQRNYSWPYVNHNKNACMACKRVTRDRGFVHRFMHLRCFTMIPEYSKPTYWGAKDERLYR
jgi:hypothetical protein